MMGTNFPAQRHVCRFLLLLAGGLWLLAAPAAWSVRIKDIANVVEDRDNQLLGYGLVVGLNRTGDGNGSPFTEQSILSMLRTGGVNVLNANDLRLENVAAVMVTADLKAVARAGQRIDVTVSSIGDAQSLQGGTLLLTKLWAGQPDNVYAIAQGGLSIGGFRAGAGGASVQENHPTVGRIANGAIVEREVGVDLNSRGQITLALSNPDYVTAMRITEAINKFFSQQNIAHPIDSGTVGVLIPALYQGRVVEFLSHLEVITVHPDQSAKIVVNERTGTIVMGEHVRISTVAVAHGSLSVLISSREQVAMPAPFTVAPPVVTTDVGIQVDVETRQLAVIPEGVTITELVTGLNALGVSPRDLITILQEIKAAGAMQAELEVR